MAGRTWTLAVVSVATALLLLDVTVVYVALPAIQQDLDASFGALQWVIDAYALVLAATLLTAGSLADRFGRRRVFLAGLGVFAAASAGCAAATSPAVLDVMRAAQGLGAAGLFASSLALLAAAYPPAERGVALGIWGAITGAALAVGPLVGGALADGPGWRWVFWLNLPICAVTAVVALRTVAETRGESGRRIDVAGMATLGLGMLLVVLGLTRGNPDGWGSAQVIGSLAAGVALLAAFVVVERRADEPMVDLALFRSRPFTGVAIVAFAQSFALYPMFLFLALYFQAALDATPLQTGLWLLPNTLVLFVVAPFAGRLTGRVPLRVLLAAGLVLIAASLVLMRAVSPDSEWTVLLPGLVVGGIAIGTISPALASGMVGVLSVERSGLASGINNTARQLGIAVGVAGLGAIFEHRVRSAPDGYVEGLDLVFAVGAVVAVAAAAITWPLLRSADR